MKTRRGLTRLTRGRPCAKTLARFLEPGVSWLDDAGNYCTDAQIHWQGEHFKRLEIFHNPGIDDQGWKCIAGIATDFEDTPLELSVCYCDLEDRQLEAFKDAVGSVKVKFGTTVIDVTMECITYTTILE